MSQTDLDPPLGKHEDTAEIAKMIEERYPGKIIYEFVVDCENKRACNEVQKYMADNGFAVHAKKSLKGDHYGFKKFDTYKDAKNYMHDLYNKFNATKSKKIKRITLGVGLQ